VKYQLPVDEGDAQVTGYRLERRHVTAGDDGGWETVSKQPITALESVVDQLEPLSEYQFRVAAVNEHGVGEFSPASELVQCPPDVEDESYPPGTLQRYVVHDPGISCYDNLYSPAAGSSKTN